MKLMITGALGYIGTELLSQLYNTNIEIIAVDNDKQAISTRLGSFLNRKQFSFYNIDIADTKSVSKLPKVDLIIHLACVVGYIKCNDTPELAHKTNVVGTQNLSNLNTPIVFVSTGSVYGEIGEVCNEQTDINPKTLYAEHKALGEQIIQTVPNVILRPATLFGCSYKIRDDLLVHNLIKDAVTNKQIDVYQPNALRSFYNIGKMANLLKHICNNFNRYKSKIVNVGCESGNLTKLQVCQIIKKYTPLDINIIDGQDLDNRDYNIDYTVLKLHWSDYDENFEQHIQPLVTFYENTSNR
tara:strand:+ start:450 stop:1343 length:894 start_codon:yes stop_codon:yes gene_type:complete